MQLRHFPVVRAQIRTVSTQYSVRTNQGTFRVPLTKVPAFIGMHTDRGMRDYNEDRMSACILELPSLDPERKHNKVFNYNIFDGHGGSDVVDFVTQNLAKFVERQDLGDGRDLAEKYRSKFGGYWRAWRSSVPKYERQLASSHEDDLAMRLPLAYLSADFEIAEKDLQAGSTATCVYIYSLDGSDYWDGAPAVVTVAQVGDTRAIIGDNRGNVLPLTTQHHPSSPHESERLTAFHDAFVQVDGGSNRFLQYTNTRAFGDLRAKAFGISAEPDLTTYLLGQNKGRLPGREAFMVLVSDGVTDKASDQEIVDLVIQSSENWGVRGTPQLAATEVVNYVVDLGTEDNASAVVVRLGGWGKWDGWTDRSGSVRAERLMGDRRR